MSFLSKIFSGEDTGNQFKIRDLRTYSSTEYLFDGKKKYRNVFHRHNIDYIYCELSLYNLNFERANWKFNIRFVCIQILDNKNIEICKIEMQKKANKSDNILFVREGWGAKDAGSFWKKGVYHWDVYVNDKFVIYKEFYVEDIASVTVRKNPFFNFKSIKLYEDDYDNSHLNKPKKYYTVFDRNETRYIYCELSLKNLQKKEWHGELYFNIYLESGELKGRIIRPLKFPENEKELIIGAGWGSNKKGSWHPGNFVFQVVFFDFIIAEIPFSIGDEFKKGIPDFDLTISNSFNKFNYELIRIPKELRTPFQQYLIFFKDFIDNTKNRNLLIEVKQSRDGLILEYATDDELAYSKEDFQKYFEEYLSFPRLDSKDWIINIDNGAKPNLDILVSKLENKINCLKIDIEIAKKENGLLLSQNDYLKQLTLRLTSNNSDEASGLSIKPALDLKQIKEILARNEVEEVLNCLSESYKSNEIYLLKSQWKNLKKAYTSNTISFEVHSRETNRIKLSILEFIDAL